MALGLVPTPMTPRPITIGIGATDIIATDLPSLHTEMVKQGVPPEVESEPEADGRQTPVPADSASRSNSISDPSSLPSNPSPAPSSDAQPQATQTTKAVQAIQFNRLPVIPAEVGLGSAQGEEQLKSALLGKDRYFLVVASKEIEGFVKQVVTGNAPSAALAVPVGTTSTSLLAGASFKLASASSSTFQRMLVYKAAEWYGLKAVAGSDGTIFIGVLGDLPEQSARLRLSQLVQAPPEPSQKFQLMRRTQASSSSGGDGSRGSTPADETGDSARKTFEEREAAYAAARERILGSATPGPETEETLKAMVEAEVIGRSRQQHQEDDEPDPIPRHGFGTAPALPLEPVFPSLYHPPKAEATIPTIPPGQEVYSSAYAYATGVSYADYTQMEGYASSSSNQTGPIPGRMMYNGAQQYPSINPGMMGYPRHANGMQGVYPAWQQHPSTSMQSIHQQQAMMQQPQIPMNQSGWGYPATGMPGSGNANQPMPMIPQGIQYQAYYPGVPQQQMYPALVQPTPLRPHPQPHSSASSSISSRSYQDYSRPHSRGSTTSTRSAASSVRLGAMYPAAQGPSYRQKGMKSQGVNSMTSLGIGSGSGSERRNRAHSPSSATTTSSRSSRRASSIVLSQPPQHPLPQKPNWAADHIQYQPSPVPVQRAEMGPSNTDFPPLRNPNGNPNGNGMYAEPMLGGDRTGKSRSNTQTQQMVWNGTSAAAKVLAQTSHPQHQYHPHHHVHNTVPAPGSPTSSRTASSSNAPPQPRTPGPPQPLQVSGNHHHPPLSPVITNVNIASPGEIDPDFPKRSTASTRPIGTLYDPSAVHTSSNTNIATSKAIPRSESVNNQMSMTPEDVIEAKLAAVSLNVGVSIGPPKSAPLHPPSYAKIVRRD